MSYKFIIKAFFSFSASSVLFFLIVFTNASPSFAAGSNGVWVQVADMPNPHFWESGIIFLDNGKVLVTTGYGKTGLTPKSELFDPQSRTWTSTGNVNQPRLLHNNAIVKLNDGKVMIAGDEGPYVSDLKTVEFYDPAAGIWSYAASLSTARRYDAIVLQNGKVLVTGGARGLPNDGRYLASTEIYDPATKQWTTSGNLNVPREGAPEIVLLPNGKVLLAGGYTQQDKLIDKAEIYNTSTGVWTVSQMPYAWGGASMTVLSNGKVLVAGGSIGQYTYNATVTDKALLYDPVANTWTLTGSMHTARAGHNAAILTDGKVLVIGGGTKFTEVYDPATGQWATSAETRQASHNGIAVLQNGDVLAVGGDPEGVTAELFTDSPSPTPPQPFLDLPWNYDCKQIPDEKVISDCEKKINERKGQKLDFKDAALRINSFFDHEFPLQSRGSDLKEPSASISATTVNFLGYPRKDILNDDIWYSSHDGYDYGTVAGVYDGDPVYPAASGIAEYKYDSAGGNTIFIDHQNGYQTRYYHLQDNSYYPSLPGLKEEVTRSTVIGRVGATGWHTDGPHIHIGVFFDKNYDKNGDHNFIDYEPMGATDPFGWEPYTNEKDKDPDPWEHYVFDYLGKPQTGSKSYYLWTKKLPGVKETVTSVGGTYTIGDVSMTIDPNTFDSPVTLEMHYAPGDKASDSIWSIGPVINITARNILGDFITLLAKPVKLIWLPFNNADLSRFKPGTFYLYSSKDGNQWLKEQEVDPFTPGNITVAASHFTYFAIMGERKDLNPSVTSAELQGLKGQGNWFRSDVSLVLSATDSADLDPAGVNYILYKIEGEDWKTYTEPLSFKEPGHHNVSFYSGDYDGNIEDVKSIGFDIDKTSPIVTIKADADIIWPPYGEMVDVKITGDSSDENLENTTFQVIDEYGKIQPLVSGFDQTIKLEAKRNGDDADGRKYTIKVISEDKAGNIAEAITTVVVPHDQG